MICKKCKQIIDSQEYWKCCPKHTSERIDEDVVCEPCAVKLHPEWINA